MIEGWTSFFIFCAIQLQLRILFIFFCFPSTCVCRPTAFSSFCHSHQDSHSSFPSVTITKLACTANEMTNLPLSASSSPRVLTLLCRFLLHVPGAFALFANFLFSNHIGRKTYLIIYILSPYFNDKFLFLHSRRNLFNYIFCIWYFSDSFVFIFDILMTFVFLHFRKLVGFFSIQPD